jgi:putative MATE family efflux protein
MKMPPLFNDKGFYRELFVIALPITIQSFINSFVNMLDTVMIGRLGTVEIAAVGLGNQFFFLFNIILFGICSGGGIFTAQFWGKRDILGIRKNCGFSLALNLFAASLFSLGAFAFPEKIIGIYSRDQAVIREGAVYLRTLAPSFLPFAVNMVFTISLRSVEKVRLPLTATLIALSMNGVLNYLFIFGAGPVPAMGVKGAALATVLSRFTEMGILLLVSYARRYPVAGSLRELLGFNLPYVYRFLAVAMPVIINEIVWASGISVQNIIFARIHTDAIAAFNITGTASQLTWVIFMGLGNGVAVLIGKRIGEGREAAARDYASRIIRFAPLVSLGVGFILIPFSRLLPLIFNVSQGVFSAAQMMFIILCCTYPARAFNMSMVIGICRAGGDTVFCALYDNVFLWFAALPAAALAAWVFQAPVWLVYICVSLEEPLKAVLGFWRFRSGKWLHHVTDGL